MKNRYVVDSMTPDEIFELYKQEIPFVNHKIVELSEKYSKLLYPNRSEIFFFDAVEYKRNSGLNIVIICLDKGNLYPKKKRLGIFFYVWFNYRNGISALRYVPDKQYFKVKFWYSSHFIERYRERCLKNAEISKPEALRIFLSNNYKHVYKNIPNEKHGENNSWMIVEDGLCLITIQPNSVVILKTFIPWESMSVNKQEMIGVIGREIDNKKFEALIPKKLLSDKNESL